MLQLITVPDENKKTGEIMNKLNIKNTNEIKRSVLGDIASNRINPPTVSLSNSSIYKSKLPVLKAGFVVSIYYLENQVVKYS